MFPAGFLRAERTPCIADSGNAFLQKQALQCRLRGKKPDFSRFPRDFFTFFNLLLYYFSALNYNRDVIAGLPRMI